MLNILLEETGRLKVTLNQEDLKRWDLTYDQLDYQNDKTRRVLWNLLKNAGSITGFEPNMGKLLIEVFPAPKEGCVIYFTQLDDTRSDAPSRVRLKRPRMKPVVYCFDDSDAMLCAMEQLFSYSAQIEESYVYELAGSYRLIALVDDLRGDWIHEVLSEFGQPSCTNRTAQAYIREHGRLLCGPHAVESIGHSMHVR